MDGAAGFTADVFDADTFKRVSPSVVTPSQLDFVDAVVISHNHYDHLSFNTLDALGQDIQYIVPLGDERYFSSDYKHLIPMDWYTSRKIADVEVIFVPANHYAGRGLFDHRESLWGGYIFRINGKSVYFAGDTGYSDLFKDIHEKYGDMDVSVLDEKPPGRQPIKTALVSTDRLDQVIDRLRAAIAEGRQCYWVCPLVEESEVSDLIAAEERFKRLRAALGEEIVGLVHE